MLMRLKFLFLMVFDFKLKISFLDEVGCHGAGEVRPVGSSQGSRNDSETRTGKFGQILWQVLVHMADR